jgi:hypothetical protein
VRACATPLSLGLILGGGACHHWKPAAPRQLEGPKGDRRHQLELTYGDGTKSSCPFVFVDEGQGERLLGEGYPGAIYRAIERDDLLPLPVHGAGPLRLRLANLVDESQYTDRLELLTVDHPAGSRALTSAERTILLVGPAQPPREAQDFQGRDRLALVAAADGEAWRSELQQAAMANRPAVRDCLTASFAPIEGRPVLEVRLKSSRWLETVTGRYFAAMGDSHAAYLAKLNAADGRQIEAWRARISTCIAPVTGSTGRGPRP